MRSLVGPGSPSALWKALAVVEDLPLFAGLDDEEAEVPKLAPAVRWPNRLSADYQANWLVDQGASAQPHSRRSRSTQGRVCRGTGRDARPRPQSASRAWCSFGNASNREWHVFISLEDENRPDEPDHLARTWNVFRKVAKDATALYIEGKVERASVSSTFALLTLMTYRARCEASHHALATFDEFRTAAGAPHDCLGLEPKNAVCYDVDVELDSCCNVLELFELHTKSRTGRVAFVLGPNGNICRRIAEELYTSDKDTLRRLVG